jgi:hypothetical protein
LRNSAGEQPVFFTKRSLTIDDSEQPETRAIRTNMRIRRLYRLAKRAMF